MQLNVPPNLETLINKRLSSGAYSSAEELLRRALEAQDAEESWTEEERRALSAHIEQGYLQAERGELIDGEQVRREITQKRFPVDGKILSRHTANAVLRQAGIAKNNFDLGVSSYRAGPVRKACYVKPATRQIQA